MYSIIGADHKEYGPVSREDVAQWIAEGRADGQTYARVQPDGEWKPLSAFAEFAAALAASPSRSAASPVYTNYQNARILAEVRDFDIGVCLSRAWMLWWGNFGLLTGATLVIWLLDLVAQHIPFVDVLLGGVLYSGLYRVYLKRLRGEPAVSSEAFSGFGISFVQLLFAGVATSLLTLVAYCCCFVLPAVYLKIAWIFSVPLVIDKRLEFWTAMEMSRKVTTRVWFKVFALVVIVFGPYILFEGFVNVKIWTMMYPQLVLLMAGGPPDMAKFMALLKDVAGTIQYLQLAAQAVLLLILPFALGAMMYAYEALFGSRPAPTA
jgi:hypothetical protein